jgi:hypothetical protein
MEKMEVNVEVWEMKEGKITAFKKDEIIYKTITKEKEPGKKQETKTEKTKICSKCKKEKPAKDFGKNNSSPDGLQYWCTQCRKESLNEKKKRDKQKQKGTRGASTREKHFAKEIVQKFGDGRFYKKQELYDFLHNKIPYVQKQSMYVMASRIIKFINNKTKYVLESRRDPKYKTKYVFRIYKPVPNIKVSNGSLPLTKADTTDRKIINWSKFKWK